MKMQFIFKHLDHSEALQDYTLQGLENMSSFLLKEGVGRVSFSKFKRIFTVEINVQDKKIRHRATAESDDPYVAADLALARLERQLLKNRKVHTAHKKFELSKEGKLNTLNSRFEYKKSLKKAA